MQISKILNSKERKNYHQYQLIAEEPSGCEAIKSFFPAPTKSFIALNFLPFITAWQ